MKLARAGWAAALVAVSAKPASAHNFAGGEDLIADFTAGLTGVFNDLPVMLALVAAGLVAALAAADSLPRVWPGFMAGLLAGVGLALVLPVDPVLLGFAAAAGFGLLAALAPMLGSRGLLALGVAAGLLPTLTVLIGHPPGTVPPLAYLGIVAALHVGFTVSLALAARGLELVTAFWMRVALRAGGAWITAIALMGLAFTLKSGV